MERLRRLFEELGLDRVETFIASGNVIFDAPRKGLESLGTKIEAHLGKSLGYEVATFVRTGAEVAAVADHRAFPEDAVRAAGAYCVAFLGEPLGRAGTAALMALRTDIDEFQVHGREVYWLCRRKQSESTFSNALFERKVGVRATFRSLTTVRKLAERLVVGGSGAPRASR